MSMSLLSLFAFTGITLALVISVVLFRTGLVFSFKKKANSWPRGRETDDPAIIKRMQDAHANCVENLPVFAVVILAAVATGQTAVTDSLAVVVVAARFAQALIHLIGTSHWLVFARANFYFVQIGVMIWMIYALISNSA